MKNQAARNDERFPSLLQIGVSKLRALGRALELREPVIQSAVEIFDLMSSPWSGLSVGDRPPWPNDITDDGTPFEFSVALDGKGCELRMLLESQSLPATGTSSWDEGLSLLERLRAARLASLERFREVQDLFCPRPEFTAHFSLWHAAVLSDSGRPLFKVYLNPAVRGKAGAPRLVHDALGRLGLEPAWDFLNGRLGKSTTPDIRYFALDLDDAKSARVKVYVGSSDSAEEVEALLRGVANISPGQVTAWLSTLTGRTGPFPVRPILCCFAFTAGQPLPTATVHVPIRCYVDDDEQAARRVTSLLSPEAAKRLTRTLSAAANRPLGVGRGLLTYASLRPAPDRLRVTVYLAPETYAIAAPRRVVAVERISVRPSVGHDALGPSAPSDMSTLSEVRAEIAERGRSLSEHPLFASVDAAGEQRFSAIFPQLAWLAMFLRDALRVSRSQFRDAALAAAAAVVDQEFDQIVGQLQGAIVARDALSSGDVLWPFGSERELVRDWAYAQVGQVLAPGDDHERLATAWSVAILLGTLCRGAVACTLDDPGGLEDVAGTAVTERPQSSGRSVLADLAVAAGSSASMLDSIERVTVAMSKLAADLETLVRPSTTVADSAAFTLAGREAKPQRNG